VSFDWERTRVSSGLDFEAKGKRIGDLRLKHSDNRHPLGYIPVPAGVIVGGPGPTVLLTGGVHGDEFEGPVALMKLLHRLETEDVRGRLIVLPALNAPAVRDSSRVSPLDGANLNRAFPGDPDGGPTAVLAHLVESVLLPECDGAIDLHSGGKAAWFTPCALASRTLEGALSGPNMALAEAFGAPLVWVLGALNENRSLNSAATRAGVPMAAAELGGGGAVSPAPLAIAERGIENALNHLGLLAGAPEPGEAPRRVELRRPEQVLYAPHEGLFEPAFEPGEDVTAGAPAGALYSLTEPERPPTPLHIPSDGLVLARCHRGLVERGEMLATIVVDVGE
jgi:predicted deacylase